jgi:CARDB
MRFKSLVCVCLIAGAAVAAGVGPAPAAAATARAELTQFACQRALDPANRSVSILAVTRPLTGTRKLAVKFDLLERTPSAASPTPVRADGLGVWITPTNPTLGQLPGDVWRLNKTVLNLDAPAAYRFRVTFRWTGALGKMLGTAVRYTRTCTQRELRPDLLVSSITVTPVAGHPEEDLYTAVIADQGATGAGPFEVLFAPGDTSAPITRTVQFLHAGESRSLSFVGAACDAASPPTVTVDATSEVDDYNRANNTMTAVCPAAATPTAAPDRRRPSGALH